jgi:hypothetical protein
MTPKKTLKSPSQDEALAPYRRITNKTPPSELSGEERLAAYRRVAQDAADEVASWPTWKQNPTRVPRDQRRTPEHLRPKS